MVSKALFTSGKDEWATPIKVFEPLDREFRFTLDVAASTVNAKCPRWFGPTHGNPDHRDGLTAAWDLEHVGGYGYLAAWMNPPYSRGLQAKFIRKAAHERTRGVLTVGLLPARTDTKVFHECIYDAATWQARPGVEIRFLPGRVKFGGAKNGAPFPSMIVVFRP